MSKKVTSKKKTSKSVIDLPKERKFVDQYDLDKIELADVKEELAKARVVIAQKDIMVLELKIKHLEAQKQKLADALNTANSKHGDSRKERQDLLKSLASKYELKSEVWGYNPLTGEVHEQE